MADSQRTTNLSKHVPNTDLLIVGPGVLGSYLGTMWIQDHPQATVTAQTNTTNNHDRLRALGLKPRTKEDTNSDKFPFVLFAAPPSGSADYGLEVQQALALWDGTGTFVFTGSAGVYADAGSAGALPVITEDSPVDSTNPRQQKLLNAEAAVLEAGGCVVRLVGLYHFSRGAHTFFAKQGKVERWGGYAVNLIHYQDAASIAAAVLRGDGSSEGYYRSKVFLGSDSVPVTFQDMMTAYFACPRVASRGSVEFTGSANKSKGKRVDPSRTWHQLGWRPRYSSFQQFMLDGGNDWYSQQAAVVEGMAHA